MKKMLVCAVALYTGWLVYGAMQVNQAQPGRQRSDAPAQHEKARAKGDNDPARERFYNPRTPAPEAPVDGRMSGVIRLTDDTRADDFPSIATNPANREEVWAAWLSYSGREDRVHLAKYQPGEDNWGVWSVVPGSVGDVWRPQVALDGKGKVWVTWAMQVGGNFDLYARSYDGERWGKLQRITTAPQGDFDHRMVIGTDGKLYVAWQGFRAGQSDIFLAVGDGEKWGAEMRVSDSGRNDWAPALAVDGKGRVVVAWDTYDRGNYDIRMRSYEAGRWGAVTGVAETGRFEAHAAVAFDGEDRLWVAYESGPVGWAKDQGRLTPPATSPGTMILDHRNVEMVVYAGGQRLGMAPDVRGMFPKRAAKSYVPESAAIVVDPQLVMDGKGRLHLLVRNQEGSAYATYFEQYVMTLGGQGWSKPARLPYSQGRVSMRAAGAASADGGLWVAWPRDNDPRFSIFINLPEETMVENVYAGRYTPDVAAGGMKIEARTAVVEERKAGHVEEAAQVAAIRAKRITIDGKEHRILRGDLHRHTELSPDLRGMPDGSILDFYRYMMDAAAMDFGMISDHQNGGDREYWWWLTEKTADLHHAPPNYTTLYGYERSVTYPNGHRNIVHTKRGFTAVPFFEKPDQKIRLHNGASGVIEDDTKMLYEEIRRSGGIAISHTSGTTMGTDWRDNDRELEPVVEIFQGDRYSYECEGCPLGNDGAPGNPQLEAPRPLGMVQKALEKGYRLGFIASSDHLSTHMSYALVVAEEATREGIQRAMRQRKTYAATDNIIAEMRVNGSFQGSEVRVDGAPVVTAKIEGTAAIADVVLIRDNKVIYQTAPGKRVAEVQYQDREAGSGLHWYYLRVVQADRQAAWISPVWVHLGSR